MMIPAVFLYTQYLMVKKKTLIALKKKKSTTNAIHVYYDEV